MNAKETCEKVIAVIEKEIDGKPYWYACTSRKPECVKASVMYGGNRQVVALRNDVIAKKYTGNYNLALYDILMWRGEIETIIKNWSDEVSDKNMNILKSSGMLEKIGGAK